MPYRYPIKFGKYLLTRRIAVGGMAEVFKAKMIRIKGFEKVLAVKKILPEFNEDDEFLQMFVDEARISSNLHHSNIVQVFDFGEVENSYYIAMELVDGPNLKNLVQRCLKVKGRFPRTLSIYLLQEITKALDYAHNVRLQDDEFLNLVHRDVSPQNILISRTGDVKITDFGIAKAAIKLSRTQPGKIQGKFSYMSPEQASGQPLDRRSDIFSLGIMAFELLSGVKLYAGEDTQKRYKQVRTARIPRLATLVPDLPSQLESLVMGMLERDMEDRPQTCSDILKELDEVASDFSMESADIKLGELADELFPPEKGDIEMDRRIQALLQDEAAFKNGAIAQTPSLKFPLVSDDEEQTDWKTKALDRSEVTVPSGISALWKSRLGRASLLSILLLLSAFVLFVDRKVDPFEGSSIRRTGPRAKLKGLASTMPPAAGPIDFDRREEISQLREEMKENKRLKEEIAEQKEELAEAKEAVETAEKKAREIAPPPPPPCPNDMILISKGSFIFGSKANDKDRNGLVEAMASKRSLPSFCIDRYEFPNQRKKMPIVGVSRSEANDLCRERGKRLCLADEWEKACKGNGSSGRRFAYGNKFVEGRCNTLPEESLGGAPPIAPSGRFKNCKSSSRVMDLSGNVEEWTSSDAKGNGIAKGGSNELPPSRSRCASVSWVRSEEKSSSLGLRCCRNVL